MIEYKGELISKNSEAYKLWEAKDFKKLDKHLKELDKKLIELQNRY